MLSHHWERWDNVWHNLAVHGGCRPMLLYKAKRQYLFILQVTRYRLLPLQVCNVTMAYRLQWQQLAHGVVGNCYAAMKSQKAVSAHFASKPILPFGFADQYASLQHDKYRTRPPRVSSAVISPRSHPHRSPQPAVPQSDPPRPWHTHPERTTPIQSSIRTCHVRQQIDTARGDLIDRDTDGVPGFTESSLGSGESSSPRKLITRVHFEPCFLIYSRF